MEGRVRERRWTGQQLQVQVGKVCLKKDCADPGGREGSEMSEVLLKCSGANDRIKTATRRAGGRFKREGTCICLWLIHAVVWQKATPHRKAINLQLKVKTKKQKTATREKLPPTYLSGEWVVGRSQE